MDPTSTQFQSPGLLVHGLSPATAQDPQHVAGHQNPHHLAALHHNVSVSVPVSVSGPPPHHFSLPTLPPTTDIDLGVLDAANPSVFHQHQHPHAHAHASLPDLQHLSTSTVPILQPSLHQSHSLEPPPAIPANPPPGPIPPQPPHSAPPTHGAPGGRQPSFGMVPPTPLAPAIAQLQQEDDFATATPNGSTPLAVEPAENRPHGQLVNRIVVDPPSLDAWRSKLFNVDDMILLTNDEFETYFPHIDNVYSHRSTQKYKRKPFVSHYWDCRMKGRPPGTPKSSDPLKKKRKRSARERDLCDVKIKITEYFPGATLQLDDSMGSYSTTPPHFYDANGMPVQPGANGEKFWTIQRVNGNGQNGKKDGVAGPHKHSLAKSDEIKKSTVQRYINSQKKESKKPAKPFQRKASGAASVTARKHGKEHDMKLYAACFCPFSQRVWIALEVKQMQYQYCETDPYKRPTQLLEANPGGTVPAIREGEWACGESSIILEYLEDHDKNVPLFPTDPRLKANCRLWIEHINTKIVPSYFALLQATALNKQVECQNRLQNDISSLVQAADERGPYFLGADLCLVDIHFAPFILRLSRMLTDLRGWSEPAANTRWDRWVQAIETNPHVQATTSTKDLYADTADLFMTGQQHSHVL